MPWDEALRNDLPKGSSSVATGAGQLALIDQFSCCRIGCKHRSSPSQLGYYLENRLVFLRGQIQFSNRAVLSVYKQIEFRDTARPLVFPIKTSSHWTTENAGLKRAN
jgi:hypothetical protein